MGHRKCNRETKNAHKFSFANPEKKRQFRRSRPKWKVKDSVVN
jgi:hypothetical protein